MTEVTVSLREEKAAVIMGNNNNRQCNRDAVMQEFVYVFISQ